jgi:hypothetical protein
MDAAKIRFSLRAIEYPSRLLLSRTLLVFTPFSL